MTRFYGKHRGTVVENEDPYEQGRVRVQCPSVLGAGRASWAMPSVPYAGDGVGLFAVPPKGALVWVEFEAGDPEYPIWAGCFWAAGQAPVSPAVPRVKVFRTEGLTVTVDDAHGSGRVLLELAPPAVATPVRMALTASGLELSHGSAAITLGDPRVSINGGALEVT